MRAAIGMVTQDTSLLHRSIAANIRYSRPSASDAQVIDAARKAQAHEFIDGLRDWRGNAGYEAHVGERGVKLSGGQRQRIALARVILKDAPILVLDEATSALDSEVEPPIQEQLLDLMEGKTVIAIAHRLSTIARMDRLVVLEDGRIVESGTHDELLRLGGLYETLWRHQSGGFLADDVFDVERSSAEEKRAPAGPFGGRHVLRQRAGAFRHTSSRLLRLMARPDRPSRMSGSLEEIDSRLDHPHPRRPRKRAHVFAEGARRGGAIVVVKADDGFEQDQVACSAPARSGASMPAMPATFARRVAMPEARASSRRPGQGSWLVSWCSFRISDPRAVRVAVPAPLAVRKDRTRKPTKFSPPRCLVIRTCWGMWYPCGLTRSLPIHRSPALAGRKTLRTSAGLARRRSNSREMERRSAALRILARSHRTAAPATRVVVIMSKAAAVARDRGLAGGARRRVRLSP